MIPEKDLDRFCQPGEKEYIGLVEPSVEGIHYSGGSMGHGFPAAVGYALSKKLNKKDGKVYVLMSDGELDIGTTWEAALIALQYKLDNLIVIVDRNFLQAMGRVEEILAVNQFAPFSDWNHQ